MVALSVNVEGLVPEPGMGQAVVLVLVWEGAVAGLEASLA